MINKKSNYISVKDLADLVGVNTKTIYREIEKREIEVIRINKIFRIHKKKALDWIDRKEVKNGGSND